MIKLSISEKLWDGVRPSSVKKTGLSEVIRDTTKALAKPLDTPKAFDDADAVIVALAKAIDEATKPVKAAKDDKKGAAAKLKAWGDECDQARLDLAAQRRQTGILKATVEADAMLKEKLRDVETALADADTLVKDITSGRLTDTVRVAVKLQDLRNAMRDGLKVTQKDGFADYIHQYEQVRLWGIDSKEVPLSPVAKTIKAKLPDLEKAAREAREAAEGLVQAAGEQRAGDVADLAQPLVKAYRELLKNIKGFIAPVKKLNGDIHAAADKVKLSVEKGIGHDKLLPIATKLHDVSMQLEHKVLTELARGRKSSGDVQALRERLRDTLQGAPRQAFERIASEEWNLIMVTFREVSEQVADVQRQVDRVMRLIGDASPEAKTVVDPVLTRWKSERLNQRNRFT